MPSQMLDAINSVPLVRPSFARPGAVLEGYEISKTSSSDREISIARLTTRCAIS